MLVCYNSITINIKIKIKMLKGLIHIEPFLKSRHKQLQDGIFKHVGWKEYKHLLSSQHTTTLLQSIIAISMAFLIFIVFTYSLLLLINYLTWQAGQNGYTELNQSYFNFHSSWNEKRDHFIKSSDYFERGYIKNETITQFQKVISFLWTNTFAIPTVYAEERRAWDAEFLEINHKVINIDPGRAITVEARFANTGTKTWKNSGYSFLSINTSKPYYRISNFWHTFWYSKDQPARLLEREVKPGETGTFRFALEAPKSKGTYEEFFILSAENIAWIPKSELSIRFNVGVVEEIIVFENEKTLEEKIVEGVIQENKTISTSTETDVIEENATTTEELTEENKGLAVVQDIRMVEPIIRVGLYKTTEPVVITADDYFELVNEDGLSIATFDPKDKVVITYDFYSNEFLFSSSNVTKVLSKVRFKPFASSTVFTITNYSNPVSWNTSINDNKFRGTLEIGYGNRSEKPWVINELMMEDYLKGLAETSEVSPLEYHKAIAVAARSYALWQLQDSTKHAGNNFTVDALWDQVYRGYNVELRLPTYVKAVEDTEGVVVTYEDEIALTPYFAQSDGRTRSYQEVWFGSAKPWLVSVPDPTNAGLKLWGHGVGMSARGALIQAARYDKTYEEIIDYYYTGIGLKRVYQDGMVPEVTPEETVI
jgi:hypothetical protein